MNELGKSNWYPSSSTAKIWRQKQLLPCSFLITEKSHWQILRHPPHPPNLTKNTKKAESETITWIQQQWWGGMNGKRRTIAETAMNSSHCGINEKEENLQRREKKPWIQGWWWDEWKRREIAERAMNSSNCGIIEKEENLQRRDKGSHEFNSKWWDEGSRMWTPYPFSASITFLLIPELWCQPLHELMLYKPRWTIGLYMRPVS